MSLQDWHHVEYLFPVGNAQHVHGENTQIMTEHFMLESYDEDCDATYFDNILVTRASPQRFCDGVEGYDSVCEGITEFHPSVDQSSYIALPVCNVLVSTNGGTCKDYCASQGRVCRHAQDNQGQGCGLNAGHDRQTMEQNGCLQTWGNQICGCAEADDDLDSMVFHATSNEGTEPDVVLRTRHGSECQLFNTPGGCDGSDSGRCGVTADGELYAYYHDAVAWCEEDNPNCGFRMGPLVREGCSRAERVGFFVECCVVDHTENTNVPDCADVVDFSSDESAQCDNHISSGHVDMTAQQIATAGTGGSDFSQCTEGCAAQATESEDTWNDCDICACLYGCQAALSGENFEFCSTSCSASTPLDISTQATCDASQRCSGGPPSEACNFGCTIPGSNEGPESLKYFFNGNLEDSQGDNHGVDHFNPPLTDGDARYGLGRSSMPGSGAALQFDGDDFVELNSPFPSSDTHRNAPLQLQPSKSMGKRRSE